MESVKKAVLEFRGMSARQIADVLEEAAAQGRRGAVRNCPLANYCSKHFGGRFVVGRKHIYRERVENEQKVYDRIATPDNMAEFIQRFDVGQFPKLEAPAAPPRKKASGSAKRVEPRKRYPRKGRYSVAEKVGRFD